MTTTTEEFKRLLRTVPGDSMWGIAIQTALQTEGTDYLELFSAMQAESFDNPESMLRMIGPELFRCVNILDERLRLKPLDPETFLRGKANAHIA